MTDAHSKINFNCTKTGVTTNALNVSGSIYLITQIAVRKFHNAAKQQVSHTTRKGTQVFNSSPLTLRIFF